MKILLVTSDLSDGGGVNRVISNLTHIFAGFEDLTIDVLHARKFAGFRYPMPASVRLITGRQYLRGANPLNLLLNLLRLRRGGYRYVLSFWTQENLVTALAFACSRTKVVLAEHLSHDQPSRSIQLARRWIYVLAHKLLVLNDQEYRYYERFLRNIELLPNPVIPSTKSAKLPSAKHNLILGVGHLTKRKGFRHLIQAAIVANVGKLGWRVKIIGDGPERADLMDLIKAHNASAFISIESPTNSIEDWYDISKLIVVPSLTEVFSMVIPEAMAYCVVPVAFSTDGPNHILRRHPDLLVPVADVPALSTRIKRLIQDPTLTERGVTLRAEALQDFSYEALSLRWQRLLGMAQPPVK